MGKSKKHLQDLINEVMGLSIKNTDIEEILERLLKEYEAIESSNIQELVGYSKLIDHVETLKEVNTTSQKEFELELFKSYMIHDLLLLLNN